MALDAHERMGADPNDRATTWRWTRFEPPRNANHEANANNRRHLLLLALAALPILFGFARRGLKQAAPFWYGTALVLSLLFFCFYLKWQPFQARMLLPLFIAASPLFGLVSERIPRFVVLLTCLYLAYGSRLALEENWTRPLTGPDSVLRIAHWKGYFADLRPWDNRQSYLDVVERAAQSGCDQVGIDASFYEIEYPFQALLRERNPKVQGIFPSNIRYSFFGHFSLDSRAFLWVSMQKFHRRTDSF